MNELREEPMLDPPLPSKSVADLLAKLEAAIRQEERVSDSHERQEAESHTWNVRMELRGALERPVLSPEQREALLWAIDGLPCMWTGRGECPHCAQRRKDYLSAREVLEAGLS